MSLLPPEPIRLEIEQVQFRSAANQSLINRMGRINNYIATNIVRSPLGTVIQSYLNEAQFQAIRGTDWVLMDGRDVTGSDYAALTGNTTIPDARGRYLRGKNNGRSDGNQNPDGDLALGTLQNDELMAHDHDHNLDHNISEAGTANFGNAPITPGPLNLVYGSQVGRSVIFGVGGPNDIAPPHFGSEFPGPTSETRPVTVTANAFIRINLS